MCPRPGWPARYRACMGCAQTHVNRSSGRRAGPLWRPRLLTIEWFIQDHRHGWCIVSGPLPPRMKSQRQAIPVFDNTPYTESARTCSGNV